jgi:hypothetical protein
VLEDGVDEQRRIAIAEAIERLRDINRHGAISLSRFGPGQAVGPDVVT